MREKRFRNRSLVFEGSVYRMNLSFLAGYELEYQLDLSGKVVFKTKTAEISTLIEVPGNKRLLSIDGMSFEHKDYQSKMHFECPRERFSQAAFVANLLFNPPLQNQNG